MVGSYGESDQATLWSLLKLGAGGLIQVAQSSPRQLGVKVDQPLDTLSHQLVRRYSYSVIVVQPPANTGISSENTNNTKVMVNKITTIQKIKKLVMCYPEPRFFGLEPGPQSIRSCVAPPPQTNEFLKC